MLFIGFVGVVLGCVSAGIVVTFVGIMKGAREGCPWCAERMNKMI